MQTVPSYRSWLGWWKAWVAQSLGSQLLAEDGGSQLVEFAVALPLLVFFTVGIFDFGSAFTIKQKLAGMAQEAARVGAAQPENDLSSTTGDCTQLQAVCAMRDVVDHSLLSAKVSDCGLSGASPTWSGSVPNYGPLTWTFTANTNCPGTLTLTIGRGYTYTTTLTSPFPNRTYTIEATKVTLSYPYRWQFGKVIGLIAPGSSFASTSQITSTAVMQNVY